MNWTVYDASALASFALLFGTACAAIGYLTGRYYGREGR
jgi:hypothetical protein